MQGIFLLMRTSTDFAAVVFCKIIGSLTETILKSSSSGGTAFVQKISIPSRMGAALESVASTRLTLNSTPGVQWTPRHLYLCVTTAQKTTV
jgi:hypothetical protein